MKCNSKHRVAFCFLNQIQMEVLNIEIFGKLMFGSDAEAWLKLCKDKKREWILKHTTQTNETLINEFISNPKISKNCKCLDCGKIKKNESSGISKTATATTEPKQNTGNSRETRPKRQPSPKKRKGS